MSLATRTPPARLETPVPTPPKPRSSPRRRPPRKDRSAWCRSTPTAASSCWRWPPPGSSLAKVAQVVPRQPHLAVPRLPDRPRRLGRLRLLGPDPAVVHVHGRRGHAVLVRQPRRQGRLALGQRRSRRLPLGRCSSSSGVFLSSNGEPPDQLHLRQRADADRPGLCRSCTCCWAAAGSCSWRRLAAILVGYTALFALYPLPAAGFDYGKVGVNAGRSGRLSRLLRPLEQEHQRRGRRSTSGSSTSSRRARSRSSSTRAATRRSTSCRRWRRCSSA